jgi:hypothetical protein
MFGSLYLTKKLRMVKVEVILEGLEGLRKGGDTVKIRFRGRNQAFAVLVASVQQKRSNLQTLRR